MKQFLALFIALIVTVTSYADCAMNGLWLFPTGQPIKQNSIFVLTGYLNSQGVIHELNKKYPVYLKSGKKKVKLIVSEICVGEFDLAQAILKPETDLEAGLEYGLFIDNLPEHERWGKYNGTTRKFEPEMYTVIAEKDSEKPEVASQPRELEKFVEYYGCGPAMYVVFSNPAKDQYGMIVRTTVKNLNTGRTTTYYVEPGGDRIKLGHGMCVGAFRFDETSTYEAEFSFMDLSGNITTPSCERIKFTGPNKTSGK